MPRPDEFQIIADYFAPLASGAPGAYGLGDDAASYVPTAGKELVLTVDAIVEGVHFLPADPAADVARKLLRMNLSDLAAKGATPRGYLLTTAWTASTPVEWIASFARGLADDQSTFGISLWGGDTVSTPGPLSFTLTAIGEVEQGQMLRRSGGKVGDDLWVTGTIGDGALGLLVALGELPASPDLLARYHVPQPRVAFGQRLVGLAHASLDVSDGLMADLGHLCQQSGTGARIDVASLPLSAAARVCLDAKPVLIETIMTGGDDYELLFSASPDVASAIDSAANQSGVTATRIGKLVPKGEGINAFDALGSALSFKRAGFRHF
ncbi:MAG: thiamine-phosphate kinase [Parvibaculum sp.]|nr:thiamine-phosphate kinase [Parvibaculum sp.]